VANITSHTSQVTASATTRIPNATNPMVVEVPILSRAEIKKKK
jgi:hypothetical protein